MRDDAKAVWAAAALKKDDEPRWFVGMVLVRIDGTHGMVTQRSFMTDRADAREEIKITWSDGTAETRQRLL